MTQEELNAVLALRYQLPEIAKQLKIMNKLKAIELKCQFHGYIEPQPTWVHEVDDLVNED